MSEPVGFRESRFMPGFVEVRRAHATVGAIRRTATGVEVYAAGSRDVVARKHTTAAAKDFARTYFSEVNANA